MFSAVSGGWPHAKPSLTDISLVPVSGFQWLHSDLDNEPGVAKKYIFQISLYVDSYFSTRTVHWSSSPCGCTNAFYSHKESSQNNIPRRKREVKIPFLLWEGSNMASESGLCKKVWWDPSPPVPELCCQMHSTSLSVVLWYQQMYLGHLVLKGSKTPEDTED